MAGNFLKWISIKDSKMTALAPHFDIDDWPRKLKKQYRKADIVEVDRARGVARFSFITKTHSVEMTRRFEMRYVKL